MLLYAHAGDEKSRRQVTAGQYLGISILIGISVLGAYGLGKLPEEYIRYLGVLPMVLGIKMWADYRKEKENAGSKSLPASDIRLWGVAMLTIANGADNIGVYTLVFSGYALRELAVAAVIFIVMTGLWCMAGCHLSSYSGIRDKIQKYKHVLVPCVLAGLGIFILIG